MHSNIPFSSENMHTYFYADERNLQVHAVCQRLTSAVDILHKLHISDTIYHVFNNFLV